MKYEITADEEERFQISFARDIENVVGLRMAPETLEPDLTSGNWLILAFAVWDSRDQLAIEVACQIATTLRDIRVAVRPFEMVDEFLTWVPGLEEHEIVTSISESENELGTQVSMTSIGKDHPIWFIFRDGKMSQSLAGARTIDKVISFLEKNAIPPGNSIREDGQE